MCQRLTTKHAAVPEKAILLQTSEDSLKVFCIEAHPRESTIPCVVAQLSGIDYIDVPAQQLQRKGC